MVTGAVETSVVVEEKVVATEVEGVGVATEVEGKVKEGKWRSMAA